MFSVFQTLERNEINPKLWLTDYLEACAKNGGKPPEGFLILPWVNSRQRKTWWQSTFSPSQIGLGIPALQFFQGRAFDLISRQRTCTTIVYV
jgi:hypothetical protein